MFIGHYSASFVAATQPKAPNLGTLFVAAQLIDFGFFGLMLLDVEHMRLVPGITAMNAMDLYDMPWTHSMVGALGCALAFALLIRPVMKSWTAAAIAGAVVFSHWLIDLVVHRPDLTLAGSPPGHGLGLWNLPAIEIPLELALAYGGLAWFVYRTRARSRSGLVAPAVLALTMAGCQAFNWFVPPETLTLAVPLSALAAYTLLALLAWWTGANRDVRRAA